MALFNSLGHNVTNLFTPRKAIDLATPPATLTPPADGEFEPHEGNVLNKEPFFEEEYFDDDSESTLLNTGASTGTKRQRPARPAQSKKRQRRDSDTEYQVSDQESENESESDFEGPTLLASSPVAKAVRDRQAMPPPAILNQVHSKTPDKHVHDELRNYTPDKRAIDRNLNHKIVRKENYDFYDDENSSDEETLKPSNAVRKSNRHEVTFDYNQERARRYAEANSSSVDAGSWSSQEQDLFTHLAMRGFEPLIPGHWIIDFKTFPQSLFSVEDGEPPLIAAHQAREFRARIYLRSLIMMGMRARDRRLVALHCESTMRKILKEYLDWALFDANLHHSQCPNTIPIHAITHQRPHEKTSTVISRITRKLTKLAKRYCEFGEILPSVEASHIETSPRRSISEEDPRFPILTGFMICASIIAIVTLDSNPALAPPPLPPQIPDRSTPQPRPTTLDAAKSESGLRIVAMLDFSEDGMDVWNALAVAIAVMRIRKTMGEMREFMLGESGTEKERRMWEVRDLRVVDGGEDEDEDA